MTPNEWSAHLQRRREQYSRWLLTSPEWQETRRRVHQRDDYRCRLCGTDEASGNLVVHHLLNYKNGWNPPLSDLLLICEKDHCLLHGRKWYLDFNGEI